MSPHLAAPVLLLAAGLSAAELVTLSGRAVIAWPTLTLRAEPGTGGEAVVSVPFGESVVVVGAEEQVPSITLGGVQGHWRQVRWGPHEGWMFDAWLLGLPAPPASCDGLDAWIGRWVPQGPVVTEWDGPPTGKPVQWRTQFYEGGMQLVRQQRDEQSSGRLWLPGVGPAQAWFVARRCHPGLAPIAEASWPPQSGAGLQVTRSDGRLEVRTHGEALISIEQRPDGVWLAWR